MSVIIFAILAAALIAFIAWAIGDVRGYNRGVTVGFKRGADAQRVEDIQQQWRERDRRNQCGRFRHMRNQTSK